jgi:futalosine hydrolase
VTQRIAIVAATVKEVEPLFDYLRAEAMQQAFQTFKLHSLPIDIIITGIGILPSTYTLMDYLSHHHPDAWIQVGIGGAFDTNLEIGEVYAVESEMIVEFGAQDGDGRIIDPFELEWINPDHPPWSNKKLVCPYVTEKLEMKTSTGMTSNLSHGYVPHIAMMHKSEHGQIENMEGAAFFYISLVKKIPFLSLRSISNKVEKRDTSKWNFELAIKNLNEVVIEKLKDVKTLFPGIVS